MCCAEGTTREHVPPKSFFPLRYRANLVTVPSCRAHNHDQSLDIEYVRNLIAAFYGVNAQGEEALEAAKRSFERNQALLYQMFGDFNTVQLGADQTAVFKADVKRIKRVMEPIANAIYFKDYGRRYENTWTVFVSALKSQEDLAGTLDQWQQFRDLLARISFTAKPVPQPAIFQYGVHEMPDGFVFEFVFYGAFVVHSFGPNATAPSCR